MSTVFSRVSRFATVVAVVGTLAGCAANPSDPNDPFEPMNRDFDALNNHLDKHLIAPIADAYVEYVPGGMRRGVSNFFNNLDEPGHVVNNVLQGKIGDAFSDAGRFVVNSTVGIGGLFDPATSMGLDRHNEDFGQTLGLWGADEGAYLVLPGRGPSSLRDIWSIPVSTLANPLTYVELGGAFLPVFALGAIDERASLSSAIRFRDESALDPYVFTREAYRQNRINLIYDGNPPDDEFDKLSQAMAAAFDEK
ncbi:MAG: VacJ family lipoprotein [Gammaproteobacteria bacterium]|nr:VacJ family lipoprotein [Gammaproteobacteria bacterium]